MGIGEGTIYLKSNFWITSSNLSNQVMKAYNNLFIINLNTENDNCLNL